jgi:cytochrome c nitrite reductase small subunit
MKITEKILPQGRLGKIMIVMFGVVTGMLIFIIYISNAASYLGDDPKTCVNCHVMTTQYATWFHGSHRNNATCNDCHVPHDNIFKKYFFKAKDGMRHATVFTMRNEPQVIMIKEEGKQVVKQNCIRCHSSLITDDKLLTVTEEYHKFRTQRQCWDCHRETPHGRVNSLSATPAIMVPLPENPVPEWLKSVSKQ